MKHMKQFFNNIPNKMELSTIKPDLERVAYAKKVFESDIESMLYDWGLIPLVDEEHSVFNNPDLFKLLQEYKFEKFTDDFIFLAFDCLHGKRFANELNMFLTKTKGYRAELLMALKFLFTNECSNVKIEFKHVTKNESTSIRNTKLIKTLRELLLNNLLETDFYIVSGMINKDDVPDWGNFIDIVLKESVLESRKGRTPKYNIEPLKIDSLQRYLQEYTELKAEQGIVISRSQALFIFKFLQSIQIIPADLSWKEDNIRLLLTKFRKKKEGELSKSMEEHLAKHENEKNQIKSKFMGFNEKK